MANNIKLNVRTNRQNVPLNTRAPAENPDVTPMDKDPFYVGAKAEVEQTEYGALITMEDKDGRTQAEVHHGEKGEKGDKGDKGDAGESDYSLLDNKPSINDVELVGNKSFEDLGDSPLTNVEIQAIFNRVFNG